MTNLEQRACPPRNFLRPPNGGGRFAALLARASRAAMLVAATGLWSALSAPAALAANGEDEFLHPRRPIAAPAGFAQVCDRYSWACSGVTRGQMGEADILDLARSVNRRINAGFHQVSDERQYGVTEVWALPTGRGGDCEDFVLLKKLALIKNGVPASRLLIATVLDRQRAPHAVLVLRTATGDLVLDNLRTQIRPWNKTGYTFLRMQNPDAPQVWQAVFAGGIFREL